MMCLNLNEGFQLLLSHQRQSFMKYVWMCLFGQFYCHHSTIYESSKSEVRMLEDKTEVLHNFLFLHILS